MLSATEEKARSKRGRELHRFRWRWAHAILVRVTLVWSSAESDEKRDPICRSSRRNGDGRMKSWYLIAVLWHNIRGLREQPAVCCARNREGSHHISYSIIIWRHLPPPTSRSTISIGHYTAAPSTSPPPHHTVYNENTTATTPPHRQPTRLPTLPPPTIYGAQTCTAYMGLRYAAGCRRSQTTVVAFFNSLKRRQKRKNVFVRFTFFNILWEAYLLSKYTNVNVSPFPSPT